MPRISKAELIVSVMLLSVLLALLGSTLVLSLFQPMCEEAVHLSGNIKYTPPTRPAFFGLEHGGRSYSVNAPVSLTSKETSFSTNIARKRSSALKASVFTHHCITRALYSVW